MSVLFLARYFIALIIISIALVALASSYMSMRDLGRNSTIISIDLSKYIATKDGLKEVVRYKVFISSSEPLFYMNPASRENAWIPQFRYSIKPPYSLYIDTSMFEKIWKPYASSITSLINSNSSITVTLPAISVNIIAITSDLSRYTYFYTIDSKSAIVLKHKSMKKSISPDSVLEDLKRDPLSVFHGLSINIKTSLANFTKVDIRNTVLKNLEKLLGGIDTSSQFRPYTPYDEAIKYYLIGDSGYVTGSAFEPESPWYKLYSRRNNPPDRWKEHITVKGSLAGNDREEDAEAITWYQFTYWFSSVYYTRISLYNSLSDAVEALEQYAQSHIPSEGVYKMGYPDFLPILYGNYYSSHHNYEICWNSGSPYGSNETVVTEPIVAAEIYRDNNAEYLPHIKIEFLWTRVSTLYEISIVAGTVSSSTASMNINDLIDEYANIPRTTSTNESMALLWDKIVSYGCDKVSVTYDYWICDLDEDVEGDEYLLLIPYATFIPGATTVYDLGSIRSVYGYSSWTNYVEPYRWSVEGYVFRASKKFTGGYGDDLVLSYGFIVSSSVEKYHTLSYLNTPLTNIIVWAIGTVDPTGFASYFLLLVNTVSTVRFTCSTDISIFVVKLDVISDPDVVGEKVTVWTDKLKTTMYPSNNYIITIFHVSVTKESSQPPTCDPFSGNCGI